MKPRQPAKAKVPNPTETHTSPLEKGTKSLADKDDLMITPAVLCARQSVFFLRHSPRFDLRKEYNHAQALHFRIRH